MRHLYHYESEPFSTEIDTAVVEVGDEAGRPYAVLTDTVLYPEGGGQPADRGSIGDVPVVDVQRREGEIRHFTEGTAAVGPVRLRLDWARRFDHMQQHTAQHLLTAVAQDRFGWATTAFHLGAEVSDIELDTAALDRGQIGALEDAVAAEVRAARPVTARWVEPAALASLAVRTRGLPAGHVGDVRLVEISGIDLNTCGGTHVRSTAELEAVALLHAEPMRGGTRLTFVAGRRLRARLAAHERRNAELRAALGAADEELAAIARRRADQLKDAERQLRHLSGELAVAVAADLAGRPDVVVNASLDGRDMGFLGAVARELLRRAPAKVALLTAPGESGALFVLAVGEALEVDVAALGRLVAETLSGRGGGSGRLFQGKAASLAGRDAALAALRDTLAT